MPARILVIDAHPDPDPARLCHALAGAYAEGAQGAGLAVTRIDLCATDFPRLSSQRQYEHCKPPAVIAEAQAAIDAATHVVFVLPIWLGGPPSLMTAWLEQVLRPGFARERAGPGALGAKRMTGRSVRIIATMAMPALAYRFWFFGHGLANLRVAVLGFVGFGPIRTTLIGGAADMTAARAAKTLAQARSMGARGA